MPGWTIRGEQNRLVEEWMEVAAYQKPLRSKAYPPESSPDTGKGKTLVIITVTVAILYICASRHTLLSTAWTHAKG